MSSYWKASADLAARTRLALDVSDGQSAMSATETRRKAVEGARTGRGLSSHVMLRSIPHVLSERGSEVLLVAPGGMVGGPAALPHWAQLRRVARRTGPIGLLAGKNV